MCMRVCALTCACAQHAHSTRFGPSLGSGRRPEITPLNGLGARARRDAKAKNDAFAAQRRCNARALLQRAHDANTLPWRGEARNTYFYARGEGTASDAILAYDSEDD